MNEAIAINQISINLNYAIFILSLLLTFSIVGNIVLGIAFILTVKILKKFTIYRESTTFSDLLKGGSWRKRAIEKGLDKELEEETGNKLSGNI